MDICIDQFSGQPELYRQPIIGAVPVDHTRVNRLFAAHPQQVPPKACLPMARSIITFFVPFTVRLAQENRLAKFPTKSWAQAYANTNTLLSATTRRMIAELALLGIQGVAESPTHNFDEQSLVSFWSHKHVAWACGLGEFGRHHMLIASAGVAGRFASLVIDVLVNGGPGVWQPDIAAFGPPVPKLCREDKGCRLCENACPTGALAASPFDRRKCYEFLLEVDRTYGNLPLSDVCGFCACAGSCAAIR